MKTEFFISIRYLMTKRKEKFISLISVISVLGVAIGVAALIVVIGVMTGFDKDLRDKIVGNYSHITLSSYNGLDNEQFTSLQKKLFCNPHVVGVSPYVQGQGLIQEGSQFLAVGIKGIVPESEAEVTKLNTYLKTGDLAQLTGERIIIGRELANRLGAGVGSDVSLYSQEGKPRQLKVVGIFHSGMYEYDMNLVFMNLATAQDFLGVAHQVSAVAIKLDNLYLADSVKKEMSAVVGYEYLLRTWTEANQNFFSALQLEKITMFIILTLIILVAAFNIVSTLIVMVVEKTKDIGILRALGMRASSIRKIFTFQGLLIGSMGTFFGVAGGVLLCALLKKYQFIKLPQDIYYLDKLPVSIEWWPDVTLVVVCALAITLISTIYPALKAASLKPVEALRYE